MVHILKRSLWMFLAEAVIPVEITSPACASTLTNAEVSVVWSFSPGTQYSYRLRVYSDEDATILIYDTGVVVSSALTTTIPFGYLSTNSTYYAKVNVYLTDGTEGESFLCQWDTDFSPSVDVTGQEVVELGACRNDPFELPGLEIRWNQVTPSELETFIRYEIRRRPVGDTAWTRIAIETSAATTFYRDYTILPGVTYEYSVVWVAISGASTLISADPSPVPFGMGEWDHVFLHDVANPENFLRFDSWEADEKPEQEIAYVQLASRQQPTAQIGERQSKRFSITALSRPFEEPLGQRWEILETLFSRQRTAGAVLMVRLGLARTGCFCQISISRRHQHLEYVMEIEAVEVNYDQSV